MTPRPSSTSVSLLPAVDVVIIGGTTGAVATALDLCDRGLRVTVVHDRTGFGEESASRLQPVPADLDRQDPLVNAVFSDNPAFPIWPGGIKHQLDLALLEKDVPFWFLTRPVALLEDEAGNFAGLLLAARTSIFALPARAVVDASSRGIVARLARVPLQKLRETTSSKLNFLATAVPAGWDNEVTQLTPWFETPARPSPIQVALFQAQLPEPAESLDPAAREWAARATLMDPAVCATAEALVEVSSESSALLNGGSLAENFQDLDSKAWSPKAGLYLLNDLLPLSEAACVQLSRPDVQVAAARYLAGIIAESIPTPGAPVAMSGTGEKCDYRFASPFLRQTAGTVSLDLSAFPVLGECDVAVAGGGTGGAGAAIAAAREGARTVVAEVQHGLGGVGTLGLIATYWFGNRCGFTTELDETLADLDKVNTNRSTWNAELKMALYARLLKEAGGEAWLGSYAFGARMNDGRVSGVLISTPFGAGVLSCGSCVDATGSADVAAAAGAPCRVIGADHMAVQGAGLSPRLIQPCYNNSDHTFIDDADPQGVTHAFAEARAKFAEDFDTSPFVDTRERRQIHGDFELSPLDFLAKRTFPDTVVTARSNFDTHGFTVHPIFMVTPPDKKPLTADVPFRCLLPQGIEGVLVTGLGVSAHRDALPVIRMQADVQNQGFASGIAAAWSAQKGIALRELDIRTLQKKLVELGILESRVLTETDSFPLSLEVVEGAVKAGPVNIHDTAVLFARAAESGPRLLDIMRNDEDPARRLDAALILGLMGEIAAGEPLAEAVKNTPWDEGWNYRGMGQFGKSMSRLDAMIIAMATAGAPNAAEVLVQKIRELEGLPYFSHCQAVAQAAEILKCAEAALPLAELLAREGMSDHAQISTSEAVASANPDVTHTEARNVSLRELHLARGLFRCGDHENLGRKTLETYTGDLRAIFAKHARAVLSMG